jgi:hypothetical protein
MFTLHVINHGPGLSTAAAADFMHIVTIDELEPAAAPSCRALEAINMFHCLVVRCRVTQTIKYDAHIQLSRLLLVSRFYEAESC